MGFGTLKTLSDEKKVMLLDGLVYFLEERLYAKDPMKDLSLCRAFEAMDNDESLLQNLVDIGGKPEGSKEPKEQIRFLELD